jgi:hypothetical protein
MFTQNRMAKTCTSTRAVDIPVCKIMHGSEFPLNPLYFWLSAHILGIIYFAGKACFPFLINGIEHFDGFFSGFQGARLNMAHEIVNIKILDARVFVSDAKAFWTVHLYVGNAYSDVNGLVFLDPQNVDLKFEALQMPAAPGFLQPNEQNRENFLKTVAATSGISVIVLERILKSFLNNCVFCMSPISSTFDSFGMKRAVSYSHRGRQYAIKKRRSI